MKNPIVWTGIALLAAAYASAPAATAATNEDQPNLTNTAKEMGLSFDETTGQVRVSDAARSLDMRTFENVTERDTPLSAEHDIASNSSFIETTDADSVNVVDTSGELLGVVEIAKAVDASGALSEARLSSSDSEISLQNSVSADSVDLVFIPARDLGQDSTVNYENVIEVPGNYLFDPNHPQKRLHDYCSNSPDEFPNPIGPNAPFHGPCAIHDMCIEAAGHHDHACDGPLRDNMKNNCRATYGPGATRGSCEATADVYYGAVTAASYFD